MSELPYARWTVPCSTMHLFDNYIDLIDLGFDGHGSKLGYGEGKSPILRLQSSNSSVSSKSGSPCRFVNWCSNDIRSLAKGPLWGVMRGIVLVNFPMSLGSQSTLSAGVPDARTGHLQGEPRMEEMPFEKANYISSKRSTINMVWVCFLKHAQGI